MEAPARKTAKKIVLDMGSTLGAQQQSTLLGMHTSFFIALMLALVALGAICCVPPRSRCIAQQPELLVGEVQRS